MAQIYDSVLGRLQSLASTKTTCDGCGVLLGERYAYWPALTLELTTDAKDKGKVKASVPEKVDESVKTSPDEYIPRKEFHFCGEDCLRTFLGTRNG